MLFKHLRKMVIIMSIWLLVIVLYHDSTAIKIIRCWHQCVMSALASFCSLLHSQAVLLWEQHIHFWLNFCVAIPLCKTGVIIFHWFLKTNPMFVKPRCSSNSWSSTQLLNQPFGSYLFFKKCLEAVVQLQ